MRLRAAPPLYPHLGGSSGQPKGRSLFERERSIDRVEEHTQTIATSTAKKSSPSLPLGPACAPPARPAKDAHPRRIFSQPLDRTLVHIPLFCTPVKVFNGNNCYDLIAMKIIYSPIIFLDNCKIYNLILQVPDGPLNFL